MANTTNPTPLYKKLGLKQGFQACVIQAPAHYHRLLDMPTDWALAWVDLAPDPAVTLDFVHIFTNNVSELETLLPEAKKRLKKTGMIWVSWFKKTSGLPTQLNDNLVRDTALALGLVDVKVCAVDDQWSGLKLVYRLTDRG